MKPSEVVGTAATILAGFAGVFVGLMSREYSYLNDRRSVSGYRHNHHPECRKNDDGSMLYGILAGSIICGGTISLRLFENNYVEESIARIQSGYAKYAKRTYAPLPLQISTSETVHSNYLSSINDARIVVGFVCSPAGGGKSMIMKAMAGESFLDSPLQTYFIRLALFKEPFDDEKRKKGIGSQQGLGAVPFVDKASTLLELFAPP